MCEALIFRLWCKFSFLNQYGRELTFLPENLSPTSRRLRNLVDYHEKAQKQCSFKFSNTNNV